MSNPPIQSAPPASGGSPAARWLGRLRRTARNLLVAQRLGWIVAVALGILLFAGAADFLLRTPAPFRIVLWFAGLAALVIVFRRLVWPAVRFNPSLTEVALRVEASEPGKSAGLTGVLASGLEFSNTAAGSPARGLAEPVIAESIRKLGTVKAAAIVAPQRTFRSLFLMVAAVALVAVTGAFEPTLTRIGAERLLWPFGQAQWPRRTGVVDVTNVKVHPLGSALALRAALTKFSSSIDDTRVSAVYRTIHDGKSGTLRRVLLTSQDKAIRLSGRDGNDAPTGTAYLFERLLEPSGLAAETAAATSDGAVSRPVVLEYWFETEDDQTSPARVLLVEPPRIRSASAMVKLPDYAAELAASFPDLAKSSGRLDLGPGTDERAAPAPILTGSRIELTLELNKPVPGLPALVPEAKAWISASLGPDATALWTGDESVPDPVRAELTTDDHRWTLSWTLTEPVRFAVKATDEHGIVGVEEATYRFDTLTDNPPTAAVVAPNEDRAVLATAVVELAGEGRDDVALEWAGLERQLARKPAGSEGAPAEPVEDRAEITRTRPADAPSDSAPPDRRRLTTRHALDLSELDLKPGDELWITASAADAYNLGGVRHEVARSAVRKLRIMSREELVEQIWSELGSIRRSAVRLDQDQREINQSLARPGSSESRRAQQAQAGITERLARQAEAVRQTEARVRENGLNDQALQDVIRRADEALAQAGEQSTQATQSLNDAANAESQESPAPDAGQKERQDADEAQQQVRRELAKLIDMLDQGEDTYASKRAIEQMIQEQQTLRERTQAAGEQTTGKRAEDLSPQEREQLERIAQDQEQLSQKLRDTVSKMQDREQKMQKSDPAGAQAMAQAAQRAQREQTAEKMQQAAQQAQQNQTNNAQQRQQQAIQSMQQMLEDLEKAAEHRDEVLRRFLASLIDSIRGLIRQQEDQIAAFDRAAESGSFRGLDAGMFRLHQNTLGVLDQAADGPSDAAAVADLIERAAEAQSAAAVALRDDPINEDEVSAQEHLSLDKLNEALEEASKIDEQAEQREQERKREALKARYADALQKQVSIREGALALVDAEPNRRNAAAARSLGAEQASLHDEIEAIRAETAEIASAGVFDFAHTRLDALTTRAADALKQGTSSNGVVLDQTSSVRLLQSLVAALEKEKNDKPFRERDGAPGGGGGGGGSAPVVPPAAEIKLLRAMQQEAVDLTRAVDESHAADAARVGEITRLQRELAARAAELLDRLSQERGSGPAEPAAPPDEPEADKPDHPATPETPVPEPTP